MSKEHNEERETHWTNKFCNLRLRPVEENSGLARKIIRTSRKQIQKENRNEGQKDNKAFDSEVVEYQPYCLAGDLVSHYKIKWNYRYSFPWLGNSVLFMQPKITSFFLTTSLRCWLMFSLWLTTIWGKFPPPSPLSGWFFLNHTEENWYPNRSLCHLRDPL